MCCVNCASHLETLMHCLWRYAGSCNTTWSHGSRQDSWCSYDGWTVQTWATLVSWSAASSSPPGTVSQTSSQAPWPVSGSPSSLFHDKLEVEFDVHPSHARRTTSTLSSPSLSAGLGVQAQDQVSHEDLLCFVYTIYNHTVKYSTWYLTSITSSSSKQH